MARALNMQHPDSTPLLDQIARYSPEELDLRARIFRSTGAAPPAAVDRLFELRRSGASPEQLTSFADQELASPHTLRATVKQWVSIQAAR